MKIITLTDSFIPLPIQRRKKNSGIVIFLLKKQYFSLLVQKYLKYLNCNTWHNLRGRFRKQNIKHQNIISSSFNMMTQRAHTCMWSPAKTIRVFLVANARGIMVSHSMAWAASSNRMCVKNPTKYSNKHSKATHSSNKGSSSSFLFC